jgi:hypothetical protein
MSKSEFFEATKKMPFVYDMLRAETLWTDTNTRIITNQGGRMNLNHQLLKRKFKANILVFIPHGNKILIFKFGQEKIMGSHSGTIDVKEVVKDKIYQMDLDGLQSEDIIYEMRIRIIDALDRAIKSEKLRDVEDDIIGNVNGGLEFFVRKVNRQTQSLSWNKIHDFDRLLVFSDDEVVNAEVVFKLVKTSK